jgi:glycerol-1-phosphate dehydrogenase [NAD(P)+]
MPGYESVFGKAKGMVFPRIVLVGHGVLDELATTCRQFGFPSRGVVITGPKTVELAGRRATQILQEGGFSAVTIIAHEANEAEVDRVAE